jgi:hypothetical protein
MKQWISGMWKVIHLLLFDGDFDSASNRWKPVFVDAIAMSLLNF